MSKDKFLEELRGYLEILEDQEQQDILEEYEQHIDIKVQNGQSEEDAIRDFGPVKELAAEILEAYHVKPEFGGGRSRKGLPGIGSAQLKDGEKKLRGFGRFLKKQLKALCSGIGKVFRGAGRGLGRFFRWAAGPFYRKGELQDSREQGQGAAFPEAQKEGGEGMEMEKVSADMAYGRREMEKEEVSRRRTFFQRLSEFFGKLFHGIWALFCWCVRLLWNVFWAAASVSAGCFALLALFGVGTVLILAVQGYPLWGAFLVCLGCCLAGGSASGLCFSLLRRKGKKDRKKDRGNHGGREDILEEDTVDEAEETEEEQEEAAEMPEKAGEEIEREYAGGYRTQEPETDWQGGAL